MRFLIHLTGIWTGIWTGIVMGALGATVQAATVERYDDPFMGCIARVSGPIAEGDTDRLDAVLTQIAEAGIASDFRLSDDYINYPEYRDHRPKFDNWRQGYRVCLDSPGGSLVEGVKLGKYLDHNYVGSAVPRDASCLSACAVAFMGGANWSDSGRQNNRVMHVRSALGFHSPSLVVPDDNYSKRTVEVAYAAALRTMAVILRDADALRFKRSLIETMLATPPHEFKMIDTVFDAGRWGIGVVGTVYPDGINAMAMRHACAALLDYNASFSFTQPLSEYPMIERQDADAFMRHIMEFQVDNDRYQISWAGGPRFDEPCPIWVQQGFARAADELRGAFSDTLYANARGGQPVWPAYFFHPTTRIEDLARADDAVFETRSVVPADPERSQGRTQCYVFKGTRQIDKEPCTVAVDRFVDGDLGLKIAATFTWPSGGKTVLDIRAGNVVLDDRFTQISHRLNGNAAQNLYYINERPISNGYCMVNSASGNTFCFEYTSALPLN